MKTSSLPHETQEQLLQDFCDAFANLRTSQEVLPFLTDLLTKAELITLTKRLEVARLLLDGKDYRTIEKGLRVSHGTIAKIAAWLADSGEGFRLVAERVKKRAPQSPSSREPSEWDKLKRRYPSMFWPQLILEEVVRNANNRERERFRKVMGTLDRKSAFYRRFDKLLVFPKISRKFNAT